MHRIDPPCAADERTTRVGFLDNHRQTMRAFVEGTGRHVFDGRTGF